MMIPIDEMEGKIPLDLEVIVSEEDNAVYVKFSGFDDVAEAESYAEYLADNLPFLLFESKNIH